MFIATISERILIKIKMKDSLLTFSRLILYTVFTFSTRFDWMQSVRLLVGHIDHAIPCTGKLMPAMSLLQLNCIQTFKFKTKMWMDIFKMDGNSLQLRNAFIFFTLTLYKKPCDFPNFDRPRSDQSHNIISINSSDKNWLEKSRFSIFVIFTTKFQLQIQVTVGR